ncbi:MAG: B12-binding domain-containing radical SAM protein [Candidatus Zipacnadales bacterium]
MRRVLFVHPRKATWENPVPHMGLASLARQLSEAGHQVTVLDEAILPQTSIPSLSEVIQSFRPDVIGFSVYTVTLGKTLEYLRQARQISTAPILVGGPHATLFPEQLAQSGLVDCVVQGEAESIIVELASSIVRGPAPRLVRGPLVEVRSLPWPDYTCFWGWTEIEIYPVSTSRGCPFGCSFCPVAQITSRQWRPRDPEDCVAEIAAARKLFPALRSLKVTDDCPTCVPEHFKTFLKLLAALEQPPMPLIVDNVRADRVDEEFLELVKAAGAIEVCLGVESGDPEVFELIGKKETLHDIMQAARLVKEHGLGLVLCFIIGLPGDSFARTRASIDLAKQLGARQIFWNMMHPFPGTAAYEWFQQHGAYLDPPRTYTSYDVHHLAVAEPVVETADFTKFERKRAYFLAAVETDQYVAEVRALGHLLYGAIVYRLPGPVVRSFFRRVLRVLKRLLGRPLLFEVPMTYTM